MNNHDINALVDLATAHRQEWGDSCHHALADEVLRLRGEVIRLRDRLQLNADLNVDRIREQGRLAEVLHKIVEEARQARAEMRP